MIQKFDLAESIVPLITPITKNGKLDINALRRLLKFQFTSGTGAIFLLGTCGEGYCLDDGLKEQFVDAVFSCPERNGIPVLIGIDGEDTSLAINQAEKLKDKGVFAFVIMPSTLLVKGQHSEHYLSHVRAVASLANLPLVLYNYPKKSADTPIPIEVIEELVADQIVFGIKDSSGDINFIKQVIKIRDKYPHFRVINGELRIAAKALAAGVNGLMMSYTNVNPKACLEMITAYRRGNLARVEELQNKFVEVWGLFPSHYMPYAKVKSVLSTLGFCDSYCYKQSESLEPVKHELLMEIINDSSESRPYCF